MNDRKTRAEPRETETERIRSRLEEELCGIAVSVYDRTDSTNLRAKCLAEEGFDGRAVFLADEQTAGRGRSGRSFFSPAHVGFYYSFLFASDASFEALGAVTPYTAVAVCRVLDRLCPEAKPKIKWVNDLLIGDRKVCGILCEAIALPSGKKAIVVGVGINLTPSDFPPELRDTAGTLEADLDRVRLASELTKELCAFADAPDDRSFMREYTERSAVLGREVMLYHWDESVRGRVVGFDRDGGLLLDVGEEKPRLYTGGEITLRFVKRENE